MAARAIAAGEISLAIAGGVESMSRAPFVMPKAATAFSRAAEIYDTTIGWRFPNPQMVNCTAKRPCRKRRKTSRKNTRSTGRRRTASLCARS